MRALLPLVLLALWSSACSSPDAASQVAEPPAQHDAGGDAESGPQDAADARSEGDAQNDSAAAADAASDAADAGSDAEELDVDAKPEAAAADAPPDAPFDVDAADSASDATDACVDPPVPFTYHDAIAAGWQCFDECNTPANAWVCTSGLPCGTGHYCDCLTAICQ